jgi:hypothetical protein
MKDPKTFTSVDFSAQELAKRGLVHTAKIVGILVGLNQKAVEEALKPKPKAPAPE